MTVVITGQWMKEQIDRSNLSAAENRNHYPIQEQATQVDLWEYVPCGCDDDCTCRKHGCTHHWKLKRGIGFEEFRDGFLRIFVDGQHHVPLIGALARDDPEGLNTRVIRAFHALRRLRDSWAYISEKASGHNKTLFCDDWLFESFQDRMAFPVIASIYLAKQYCVLFPDICVPYDTASREKMLQQLDLRDADYVEFLSGVRETFLRGMSENRITLPELRRFDAPQKALPFNPGKIALPRTETDYGEAYTPAERTISLVLDKCFYQPKIVRESRAPPK